MAMTMSVSLANKLAQAIADELSGGYLSFQPEGSSTVHAWFNLPSPAFTTAANGSIQMTGSWPTASAWGNYTLSGYRLMNAALTASVQGTVGVSGSGADLIVAATSVSTADTLTVTAFTYTA